MDERSAHPGFGLCFESADEEEIAEHVAADFPRIRMAVDGRARDAPAHLRQVIAGDSRLTVQRFDLTLRVHAFGNLADVQHVGLRRAGAVSVGSGPTSVDTSRPFLFPAGDFASAGERESLEALAIGWRDLERAARAMTDDADHHLRFTGSAPVSPAAERYWRSAHRHVGDTLLDPALREAPLIRDELFRFAVRSLLVSFPSTVTEARTPNALRTPHRGVDPATAFIEANAHRPIDLADIAAAAGAGPQALARAFRQRHGRTPMQYLRELRFQHVHRELTEADPWSGVSVAEVARRWGFAPTGRFAGEYRQRFGEPPSATLRR